MAILGLHSTHELAVFITSLLTGVAMVMGINAINSDPSFMLDYYRYVGKDANAQPKFPSFWANVLSFYTVVSSVAQTMHEPTNLTSFMCRFSLLFRLTVSAFLMMVELLVIVLLPHTGTSETGAMAALIFVAYLGGTARAYFENTGYALFGPCPSKMLSAMLVGAALSGAVVSVFQIILRVAMPSTHEAILTQSILYFSFSLGIIFLTAVLLVTLLFNPFAKRYIAEFRSCRSPLANIYRPLPREDRKRLRALEAGVTPCQHPSSGEKGLHDCARRPELALVPAAGEPVDDRTWPAVDDGDDDGVLHNDCADPRDGWGGAAGAQAHQLGTYAASGEGEEPTCVPKGDVMKLSDGSAAVMPDAAASSGSTVGELARAEVTQALTTAEMLQGVRLWPVIKEIWPMMLSCLLTFLMTYLVYPGLLTAVDAEDGWYTTLVMTVYNFGDLLGRIVSMWKRIWPSRKFILIGSIARVVFIPLLVLCALGKIPGHAPAYVFTALLAISNGFFGTLSMVYAPETPTLKSDGERALAGQANGVCLLLGSSVGALLQLAIVLPFN